MTTKSGRNTPFDDKWPGNTFDTHGVDGHRESLDDATEEEWNHAAAMQRQVGGNHYKEMAIEPIVFILANGLGYCEGNIIKYICRHASKGGLEDIDKVIHYCELLKELKYGD